MVEITKVNRRTGLIGDDAEHLIVHTQEAEAAQFLNAPARLARTRRVNGGQYVEYTYVRDDDMAFLSSKTEPAASIRDRIGGTALGDLVKKKVEAAMARKAAAESKVVGAFAKFDSGVSEVDKVADEIDRAADALTASVAQLTNGGPT